MTRSSPRARAAARALPTALLVLACATTPSVPELPPAPTPVAEDTVVARVFVMETAPRERLRMAIDSLLAIPEFRNARVGVLVVQPERMDTIYSRDAGKLFLPASNQKLVAGAVALRRLGPEYRFTTTLAAAGPVSGGVLRGDLVVHGRGDPTFSTRARGDAMTPLREMADSLAARGIRRITGRVVAGDTVFTWPTRGYGYAWENLQTRFGAPVSELMFNEGSSRLTVTAGPRVGAPATASADPVTGRPAVRMAAITLAARSVAVPSDTLALVYGAEEVVVRGGIPLGESRTVDLIHVDARATLLEALQRALAERGIAVGGVRQPPRVARDTLVIYRSVTLAELSALMQKPSQNQVAEVLKRALALELTGVGASDSGRRILEEELLALGAEPDGFVIGDAAGLSRYSFLTPETIVRLLHAMRDDSVFVNSLPLIGAEGTVANRLRGSAAHERGRAKTGTISNAAALSGYLRTIDGEPLIFSILTNNWSVQTRDAERLIDAIVERLASVRYIELAAER